MEIERQAREDAGTHRHALPAASPVSQTNRPRVCILTTSHLAKDDRVFHKEALSLERLGFDVCMIAPHDREETIGSIRVYALPKVRSRLSRYVGNALRALRLAWRTPADVYHFHDPELLWVGVALRLAGRRVVYDAHEDYQQKALSSELPGRRIVAVAWRIYESLFSRFFNHIITADSYTRKHFPANRSTVLANYPPSRLVCSSRRRGDDGAFRLIYVGGLSVERGIDEMLNAVDLLEGIAVELHLAGPPPDEPLARRIARHPNVVYHGMLPWEEVGPLLADADLGLVLLQPVAAFLYCPGENVIKLFEYMAAALPVLISNFPKLKSLVELVGCGLAVDPTSPQEIAAAIKYLHQNPDIRRRMGDTGRRAVRDRYNWECEERKLLAIYQEILGGRKPPSASPV